MSLFEEQLPPKPLAERMRPTSLEDVLGQDEAVALLTAFVEQGDMPSMVLWGPPGSGKTTLSRLMASLLGWEQRTLNATSASVKDIRELAAEAKEIWRQLEKRTLLFIDEIHRLNKAQQDVLLPIVEAGTVILAGSTTENPFFSLNQALQSRVQLIQLNPLEPAAIQEGLDKTLRAQGWEMADEAKAWIADRVAGDLRMAYTVLEGAAHLAAHRQTPIIGLEHVKRCLRQTHIAGDRQGDKHYDLASAYQKSLRGSDANAAIYYLSRFLQSGEDPRFIARRLLVTAAEDVGNADPRAFLMASHCFRAVEVLGMPEARIPLAQTTLYVARAPKSNESITAIDKAAAFLSSRPLDPVPKHLRDAHYPGAKKLGHGKDYIYTHNHPEQSQVFLPKSITDQSFVQPAPSENADVQALRRLSDYLQKHYGEGEWFELEPETLAQELKWPVKRLRAAINHLVREHKLAFKRQFQVKGPKPADVKAKQDTP